MSGTIISGLFDALRLATPGVSGTAGALPADAPGGFGALLDGAVAAPVSPAFSITPFAMSVGKEETISVSSAPITSTAALLSGSAHPPLSAPALSLRFAASSSQDAPSPNLPASVGTLADTPHISLSAMPPIMVQDDARTSKTGRLSSSPLSTPMANVDDMSLNVGPQETEGAPVAAPAAPASPVSAKGADAEHVGIIPTMYIDSPFSGQIIQRGIAQGATTRPAGLSAWADMPRLLDSGEETTAAGKTALAGTDLAGTALDAAAADRLSVDDALSVDDRAADGDETPVQAPTQDMTVLQPPLQFQMQVQAQLQGQPQPPIQAQMPVQTAPLEPASSAAVTEVAGTKRASGAPAAGGGRLSARTDQAGTQDPVEGQARPQERAATQPGVVAPVPQQRDAGRSSANGTQARTAAAPANAGATDNSATRRAAPREGGKAAPLQIPAEAGHPVQGQPSAQASIPPSLAAGQPVAASGYASAQPLMAEQAVPRRSDDAAGAAVLNRGGRLASRADVQVQGQDAAQAAMPDQAAPLQTPAAGGKDSRPVTARAVRAQAQVQVRQAVIAPVALPAAPTPAPVSDRLLQSVQATGEGPARMAMSSLSARLQSAPSAVAPAKVEPGAAGEATALLGMIVAGRGKVAGASADRGADKGGDKGGDKGADIRLSAALPDSTAVTGAAALPSNFAPFSAPVSTPVADLGATLGQQVIDMSSGGQWIDGLAREIAALSAGTGQGSFRLSPEHLGPMRVDIQAGEKGSAVTLTVETKAAETALTQDKGALQADARLAGVGIAEVKIERMTQVAETNRSDTQSNGNNNQNPQSQAQQHQQQAALAQGNNGQSAGNSHQQRKVFNDNAVSNPGESNDRGAARTSDETRRARYA